jgi:hypothetical protein
MKESSRLSFLKHHHMYVYPTVCAGKGNTNKCIDQKRLRLGFLVDFLTVVFISLKAFLLNPLQFQSIYHIFRFEGPS